ncbi:S9 family peptidase [Spirosoma endbachense]|uniref:Acyl-peptide hydrolase n=1 Tax=Spirosoma endbachense TaxID=2666025 RepID=A0A6P1W984_9BACT|nr:S9 family peptidase [Spirosoma endbachense]QHW00570.1 prolyl oligopeptidase family serine peptidase [Spirosoma endbachense]
MTNRPLLVSLFALASLSCFAQTVPKKRPITPKDIYRLQTISDPQLSPDGKWITYGLSTVDTTKDKRNSDLWMVSWDGKESVQLTNSPDGESKARFSPDGKYISFVSARQGATKGQIWLMDRRGGEAKKLTDLKTDLDDYVWSPDSKRLALVLRDPDYADSAKTKVRKPYVLDRYHFKADIKGYLEKGSVHLYVYDIADKKLDTLTTGIFDETSPVWSPDGSQLAFVSNRSEDPDRNQNTDIYVIDAHKGASMKQLTNWSGSDNNPVWSPDGKRIAYLRSTASGNFLMYDQPILAVMNRDGGEPTLLSKALDRPVRNPRWAKDGQTIGVLVQDDRQTYVGNYTLSDGKFTKVVAGNRSFSELEAVTAGNWLTQLSDPQTPAELYAIENGTPRRLTHVHDAFLAPLELATVEGFTSKSKDGAQVSNILLKPANTPANKKLPTVFYIHGGPVSQDEFSFDLTRQLLSAGGYAVVAVNYRGSNGRGLDYTKAIYADWGNKEVLDILGAADYVVEKGIADPDRLGIGGWSYGGILTNYTIATDTRFKAAASGAGSSLQLSMYGVDQYTNQYENELGAPWKNTDKWLKLSYPFLKADRIKTPTMFMAGEKDFNVPAVGSEQMFQALRSLGIPTQLIIYPGQFHGITVPSYQKDRVDRYLQWFDKYLKPKTL